MTTTYAPSVGYGTTLFYDGHGSTLTGAATLTGTAGLTAAASVTHTAGADLGGTAAFTASVDVVPAGTIQGVWGVPL